MSGITSGRVHVRALFFVIGATGAFLIPFFVLLLQDRGLTTDRIGLVVSGASLAGVLAAPIWSHLADARMGASRTLALSSLASASLALALFAAGSGAWAIFGLSAALGAAQAPTVALSDTLALGYLGPDRMHDYGNIRLWASAGWAVVIVIAGAIYQRVGLEPMLPLYASGALVQAAIASRSVLISPVAPEPSGHPLASAVAVVRASPGFARLLGALLVASAATWAGLTFIPVLIVSQGGDLFLVGLAASIAATVEIPIFRASSWLGARFGLRALYSAGASTYVATLTALALSADPVVTAVARMAVGVAYGLTSAALVVAVGRLVPESRRNTGQALLYMTTLGIGPVAGAAIGGVVYASLGPAVLFGAGALVAAAASVVVASSLTRASR